MVTLYGHIDLDLDSAANLNLDSKFVKKSDLISNHLYSGTMGVSEKIINTNFEIFPNPTKDLITIKFDNPKGSKLLTILNMTCQEIYQQEFTEILRN